ncbi:MAG TPA: helix-turn-helix transcriptional regulator [Streptosporangiaceae bacterium]|nr:helix-turn-helix transcriptional regulator [Streptosporangiaceae bacterium]
MTEDWEEMPRPSGRAALPQQIAAARLLACSLSPRERAAFELLGLGYDNRSMARALEISERTVKRHVTAILAKLRLESRLQAGLAALIMSSAAPGPAWPEGRMDLLPGADETDWQRGRPQEETMTFDALAALRRAGNPVDLMTTEQQEVLAQLTEAEVAVLNSVKHRMDAVSDFEVEAHGGFVKIV